MTWTFLQRDPKGYSNLRLWRRSLRSLQTRLLPPLEAQRDSFTRTCSFQHPELSGPDTWGPQPAFCVCTSGLQWHHQPVFPLVRPVYFCWQVKREKFKLESGYIISSIRNHDWLVFSVSSITWCKIVAWRSFRGRTKIESSKKVPGKKSTLRFGYSLFKIFAFFKMTFQILGVEATYAGRP